MLPYCVGPVPQLSFEKSSVKDVNVERVLVFSFVFSFVFLLVFFVATFELALFVFPLLLFSLVTLAIANTKMTMPIPINTSTAPMPNTHGQTLRFCAAGGGIGDHGGCDGGGSGAC